MMHLKLSENTELDLLFNEKERFSSCSLIYKEDGNTLSMYEDYLYYYVEFMLYRIKNIHTIESKDIFGKVGKWQQCYMYSKSYYKLHAQEFSLIEKTEFISTAGYGVFLYSFDGSYWMEIDKGYSDDCRLSPIEYFSDFLNYRMLLTPIPKERIDEWFKELIELENFVKIR